MPSYKTVKALAQARVQARTRQANKMRNATSDDDVTRQREKNEELLRLFLQRLRAKQAGF